MVDVSEAVCTIPAGGDIILLLIVCFCLGEKDTHGITHMLSHTRYHTHVIGHDSTELKSAFTSVI